MRKEYYRVEAELMDYDTNRFTYQPISERFSVRKIALQVASYYRDGFPTARVVKC